MAQNSKAEVLRRAELGGARSTSSARGSLEKCHRHHHHHRDLRFWKGKCNVWVVVVVLGGRGEQVLIMGSSKHQGKKGSV